MGKKSNCKGGKKGKSQKQSGRQNKKRSPSLPPEVLAVVAEFIVGQHAFGTAANPNQVSRSVHHETLPVLFETLVLDDPYRKMMQGEPSESLQYTKFIFYTMQEDNEPGKYKSLEDQQPFEASAHVPRVVMTIPLSDGARLRD
ncbi:hypothetical protein QFC20_004811 [Naganishia adeliensis]|uniref:Uncharacterized protein n=1 Tax=Naganishia adeliensis TaxID=92952 RepID=A0ACC2VWG4_9TREE|nr:hypothetical protein QFC20_004811 [Naganishia adeliensis]